MKKFKNSRLSTDSRKLQTLALKYENGKRKEKVGGRTAKLNEKEGDMDLEREIKNKGDIFLLEELNMKIL